MALFGGSFNPPTRAHRLAAERVRAALPDASLTLLPAPRVAHKDPASLVPFHHRLHMVRLAVEDMVNVTVSDFADQVDSPQTVEFLRAYRAAYPDRHIIWVMGADSFASLPEWDAWEEIMTTTALYVLARPDQIDGLHHTHAARRFAALEVRTAEGLVSPKPLGGGLVAPKSLGDGRVAPKPLGEGGWHFDNTFHVPVSATAVRAALAQGEASPDLADGVAEYIRNNGLYS